MHGLYDEFDSIRDSLLHRMPPPSLDAVISELLTEETRLASMKSQHNIGSIDSMVAAVPSPLVSVGSSSSTSASMSNIGSSKKKTCRYCKKHGHVISGCFCLQSKKASKSSQPTPKNPQGSSSVSAAVATEESRTLTVSMNDLQNIVKQLINKSGSSLALSTHFPKSSTWYFDSACCNHMTPNIDALVCINNTCNVPYVRTANNSSMSVNHVGNVSDSKLTLSDVFHIPTLSLNLISVGQLTEFNLDVVFSNNGCRVQDPQTG